MMNRGFDKALTLGARGTEAQKQTEPCADSDARRIQTAAVKNGDRCAFMGFSSGRLKKKWGVPALTIAGKSAVISDGTRDIHTLMQADDVLGFRQDKPLRCELPQYEG